MDHNKLASEKKKKSCRKGHKTGPIFIFIYTHNLEKYKVLE